MAIAATNAVPPASPGNFTRSGKWPGQQDVIIHEPHDLHRQVQHSGL